jgi:hypothetical protein
VKKPRSPLQIAQDWMRKMPHLYPKPIRKPKEKAVKKFYVCTFRPPHPHYIGLEIIVYRESEYSRDVLPATMTSVWEVECVHNKREAIAAVIEKAAGKGACVRRVF